MTDTRRINLLVSLLLATLACTAWAMLNRPIEAPPWPERVLGFSFSPLRAEHDPVRGRLPDRAQIEADLALLSDKTHAVRTYSVRGPLAHVPSLARRHGINVAPGAWIGPDRAANEEEIARLVHLGATEYHNMVRIVVGNEVLQRGDLPPGQLIEYLDRVRGVLDIPVSTAEPWHVWLAHPELTEHVDYLAVHILPYWEGVARDAAVEFVVARMRQLETAFPNKPIVIAEVGWPSRGRTIGEAVASPANEARFLREFLARAAREDFTYYLIEAFDQPWKRSAEGDVGAYWGVFDAARLPKFALAGGIVPLPEWRELMLMHIAAAAMLLAFMLTASPSLSPGGRVLLGSVVYALTALGVWIGHSYLEQYLTMRIATVGAVLGLGILGITLVLLAEAHEWVEAAWFTRRQRALRPVSVADDALPMVSIHVPAYNEPPEMLIQTLDALARLDYPHFEVLIIDNNTKDPAVWRPVEAHCAALGERFRFFHVEPLAGFKAGALNYALERTAPGAEVVAVIDSDYVVEPDWLRELVPQFSDPAVAIVQAPQDFRDAPENTFKAMAYEEYRGFFQIGMVTRNERNAIIQHGTMTMVRRRVLEEVGRWSPATITEDAELGLRIFAHGYQAVYTPRSFGRGLMPDTFLDYKKQRLRWAFGAVQILRRHAAIMLGLRPSRLTAGQRYHFIAGWLPWIADGLSLVITALALGWSLGMLHLPQLFEAPPVMFSALPLLLFAFKLAKLACLYPRRVGATMRQTLGAALAGLSLSHSIAVAVLSSMVVRDKPFFRTPKQSVRGNVLQALAAARTETLLLVALGLAATGVLRTGAGTEELMWAAMLAVQAVPYLAALAVSLISSLHPALAGKPASRAAAPANTLAGAHS